MIHYHVLFPLLSELACKLWRFRVIALAPEVFAIFLTKSRKSLLQAAVAENHTAVGSVKVNNNENAVAAAAAAAAAATAEEEEIDDVEDDVDDEEEEEEVGMPFPAVAASDTARHLDNKQQRQQTHMAGKGRILTRQGYL